MLLDSCQRVGARLNGQRKRGAPRKAPRVSDSGDLSDVGCQPCRPHVDRGSRFIGLRGDCLPPPGPGVVPLELLDGDARQLDACQTLDRRGADGVERRRRIDDGGECGRSTAGHLPETCLSCTTWVLQCSLPSGRMNETRHPDVPRLPSQTSYPALPRRGPSTYPRDSETWPVPAYLTSFLPANAWNIAKENPRVTQLFRPCGPACLAALEAHVSRTRTGG